MDDTTNGEGSVEELTAELARVRAERDAARTELERAEAARDAARTEAGKPSKHRVRRVVAVVLVIASCASFLTGGVGLWASRNLLNTDVWLQRTDPLIEDPAVQQAVSREITDSVMQVVDPEALFKEVLPERGQMLAGPLSGAVEGFVGDQVTKVVESDKFAQLWDEVNERAHTAAVKVLRGESEVVTANDDSITVNLLPIINQVLARLTSISPELFGRTVDIPDVQIDEIPTSVIDTLNERLGTDLPPDFGQITIDDNGQLKEVQDAVAMFDKIVWVSIAVFIVSTIGALALSVDRRRTLLQLAIADVVLLVLMRRGAVRAQEQVLQLVRVDENRPAVKAITSAMFEGLFTSTRILLWGFGIMILIALVTGPGRRARQLRSWTSSAALSLVSSARERGSDPATAAWIVAHRDALQIAVGAVAVVLLWWLNLGWFGILSLLVIAGVLIALLARLPDDATSDDDSTPTPQPT